MSFSKSIPDAIESVGALDIAWRYWRELGLNLVILVRCIKARVETICCVITVSIAAAEPERACMYTLGHDPLSKMSVVGRNGGTMSVDNGGIFKTLPVSKAEDKRGYLVSSVATTDHFHAKEIRTHRRFW